jgi:hypothetical protein
MPPLSYAIFIMLDILEVLIPAVDPAAASLTVKRMHLFSLGLCLGIGGKRNSTRVFSFLNTLEEHEH